MQWAPSGIQAKPYEECDNAASKIFLEYYFLKLVNCDIETHDSICRLRFQNIKYLMYLEKKNCISHTNFIKFFHKMYMEEMLEYIFLGCPYHSNSSKTWLDAALLKRLKFDLTFHLILDVSPPPTFRSKQVHCGH